ncbi:hypothetical protein TEA_021221 [Camellia sinensis var. sinensis]|uniref:Complex III subunit VII n=1 Tax=Camellia sinensis var. sinensis TaxID=542762 RepID=A0A4S4EPB3_CAMSN|nr:hypothetical protein TEA_021221 [Camellia sinensis var. sinensis]
MASSLMKWLVDPKKNWFAAQHMKSISKRLRRYGLPLSIQFQNPNFSSQMDSICVFFDSYCLDVCEGLRYDDLFDPYYDLDVKEALNRLPREIVDARNQRLKRAMDLSMKHDYLPEHLQAMQTPYRSYLQDMLALVKRENAEREALGALPLYQRTIP